MSEAERLLRNLVEGLNLTYWCDSQSVWKFSQQLIAANEYLNKESKL